MCGCGVCRSSKAVVVERAVAGLAEIPLRSHWLNSQYAWTHLWAIEKLDAGVLVKGRVVVSQGAVFAVWEMLAALTEAGQN